MKREYYWWLGVGLFTVITMGIMTGMGIRDGDWGTAVAGLTVCVICLVVQTLNVVKLVENTARVETLMETWEWLDGTIKENESEKDPSESSGPEEGEA